ncbi:MAG: hypothetical protein PHY93_18585 [Bacteriovorax sp.]|nr:hypothetical protein [Bacteriovorax sp.]
MKKKYNYLKLAFLALFLCSLNSFGTETSCLASYKTPYLKWKNLPIPIYASASLPPRFKVLLNEEIQKWNSSFKMKLFDYRGSSTFCHKKEINCVVLEKHSKYLALSGVEDYALTKQDFKHDYWVGADIFLNSGFKWKHPASVGEVDPGKVILHELGHVLGLQHHFFHLNSIMNYLPYEAGDVDLEISIFDKEILEWLYLGGKCPEDYLLAFIDGQEDLSMELLKKKYTDFSKITDVNLLYLISRLERSKNELDNSLKTIDMAIELSSHKSNIIKAYLLNHKADLYFRKNDIKSATKNFEESLKLWPGNYLTLTYLAQIKILMGESNKEALALLKQALKIKPTFKLAKELSLQIKK